MRTLYILRKKLKFKGVEKTILISSVKKIGYISGAYVLSEFRGKGVMKSLEKIILDYFKQCGLKYIEVNFLSTNLIAKKSWEGLGYKTFREQARKEI